MKKSMIVLFIVFSFFIVVKGEFVSAEDYYVSPTGTASWSNCKSDTPLSGTSACSISTANSNAQAGDTVYLRGGDYTFNGANGIDPYNTGTSGNPITFSAYNDETVTFTSTSTDKYVYAVDLDSRYGTVRSYIKVHRITFVDFNRHLWIRKGDYNEISNCSFSGATVSPGNLYSIWRISTLYEDAQYNWIHDCTFHTCGGYTTDCEDACTCFELGNGQTNTGDTTAYNVFENNHLYHGGHHVMGVNGHKNIVRNNYFHNEPWAEDYEKTGVYSNRVLFFGMGYDDQDERDLFEGNRVAYGGECPPRDPTTCGPGSTICTRYNIIRYNEMYKNDKCAHWMMAYSGCAKARYNKIYSNTYWNNGIAGEEQRSKEWWNPIYTHAVTFHNEQSDGAFNNVFKNNIFYQNANEVDADEPIMDFKTSNPPTDQIISNNWIGDRDGNPLFADISGTPADPMNETQYNFNLQSNSDCIDSGTYLTQAKGSSSGSTTLYVDDAGYFQPGWGDGAGANQDCVVETDWIAIGTISNTVQITSIDYANNKITLAAAKSWSDNDPVWLYKDSSGNRVLYGDAPDIGAHEYSGNGLNCGNSECETEEGECSSCPQDCNLTDCHNNGQCDTGLNDGSENCETDPADCACSGNDICCSGSCQLPLCSQGSDCGTDSCKTYICNNPGTCSASCISTEITQCINNDGCCPSGCTSSNDNDCQSAGLCNGLVLLHHLDKDSSTITDYSGNNNHGTVIGATYTSLGRFDGAFEFDGTNDYIDISDSSSLDFDKSGGAIIMWVKPVNPANGDYQLLTIDSDFEIELNMQGDGDLFYYPYYNSATKHHDNYNLVTNPLTANLWQQIATTWDYSSKEVKIYVNGVKQALAVENVPTYWDILASTGDWHFGGSPVKDQYFNGIIDEVAIWSRALSSDEILNLYNSGGSISCEESLCGEADTDNDGIVDLDELYDFIDVWKQNLVTIGELMASIGEWKYGC